MDGEVSGGFLGTGALNVINIILFGIIIALVIGNWAMGRKYPVGYEIGIFAASALGIIMILWGMMYPEK